MILDLTNGHGKAILSWVQIGGIVSSAFLLGTIWADVRQIKIKMEQGLYTKADIDDMQKHNQSTDWFLTSEILRVDKELATIKGAVYGVRVPPSK